MSATRPPGGGGWRAAAAAALVAVTAAWAAWLAAAPAVAAADVRPALWAAAAAYRAGALVCHQQDARSLHVAGVRMPVCARCFGLYAGGAMGAAAAAAWLLVRRPATVALGPMRAFAVAAGMPTLLAWAGEHLAGLTVPGSARAILALPLGAAVAAIVALWAGGAAFEDTAPATALH